MNSERRWRPWRRVFGSHPDRRTFISISWLDAKLGIRLLAKYPGLSIVAVVGMALAILIGAGTSRSSAPCWIRRCPSMKGSG